MTYRAVLSNDFAFALSGTQRGINIRADVAGDVASVRFGLNKNENAKTESTAPYALRGDNKGDYSEWIPAPGAYTITATPYPQSGARGAPGTPYRVTFRVTGEPQEGIVGPVGTVGVSAGIPPARPDFRKLMRQVSAARSSA
jgi:hypothetical protein